MADRIKEAVIIGAGIGGMAAALAMATCGIDVRLVEVDPDWSVYGAGITITGATLRAFRDLGLLDAIREHGFLATGAHMFRYDGVLLTTSVAEPIEPGLPASGGIMRPKLHRIMTDQVRARGIRVSLGATVGSIRQLPDAVELALSNGETLRCGLVVGADGIYSTTRRHVSAAPVKPVYTGQMSWRIVGRRPADLEVAQFYFGHRHIGGIIPCSNEEVYAFVLNPEATPRRVPDEDKASYVRDLLADFGGLMGELRDEITRASEIVQRPFEYALQPLPWHAGRVTLLGDAAHATTAHLASGAGLAVEDAIVLAEELDRRPRDVTAALAAFERRRFQRCRMVVESSVAIGQAQLDNLPSERIGMMMGKAMHALAEAI